MWEILTFFALFLTFLTVIWYAWETRKLRIETLNQTKLSLRPFVIIVFIERPGKFILKNLGNGSALNVKVKDISLIKTKELQITYFFHRVDVIPCKEEKDLYIGMKENDSPADRSDLGALLPQSAVNAHDFEINYTDINNQKYRTMGTIGKGGVIIKGTD